MWCSSPTLLSHSPPRSPSISRPFPYFFPFVFFFLALFLPISRHHHHHRCCYYRRRQNHPSTPYPPHPPPPLSPPLSSLPSPPLHLHPAAGSPSLTHTFNRKRRKKEEEYKGRAHIYAHPQLNRALLLLPVRLPILWQKEDFQGNKRKHLHITGLTEAKEGENPNSPSLPSPFTQIRSNPLLPPQSSTRR